MEIALDDVVLEIAFGQRARPVRAHVVGDEELAADVEHRQRQILNLDLERVAGGDLVGAAQFDPLSRHGRTAFGDLLGVTDGRYTQQGGE